MCVRVHVCGESMKQRERKETFVHTAGVAVCTMHKCAVIQQKRAGVCVRVLFVCVLSAMSAMSVMERCMHAIRGVVMVFFYPYAPLSDVCLCMCVSVGVCQHTPELLRVFMFGLFFCFS
eukprot:GDKI01044819.1.p1 GENE.GDKI01044819.1~~GDKI01044819.1.p1  ORF type:complete len:119 (+),score=51.09 GDKI01044819.1:394-750(+)